VATTAPVGQKFAAALNTFLKWSCSSESVCGSSVSRYQTVPFAVVSTSQNSGAISVERKGNSMLKKDGQFPSREMKPFMLICSAA